MHGEERCAGFLGFSDQCFAGSFCKGPVGVVQKFPFGFGELRRTMERVPEDDEPFSSARNHKTCMPRRVTRGVSRSDSWRHGCSIGIDQINLFFDHSQTCGALTTTTYTNHKVFPVSHANSYARIREYRVTTSLKPTKMIGMQMTYRNDGDIAGLQACRGQEEISRDFLCSIAALPENG